MGVYLFDDVYKASRAIGFCSDSQRFAATQHMTPNSTITLCPSSFGTENKILSSNDIKKIRSKPPAPVKRAQLSGSGDDLRAYAPTSATLLHELFHLVLGNGATFPSLGEIYLLRDILPADFQTASVNPETFTLVAVGYDYTLNSGQDAAGNKVEFYSGYATQG